MSAVQRRVSSSPRAASTPPLSTPAMHGRMGAHWYERSHRMDDRDWLASIPEATDEEMAALVVSCRMGKRRCQATCHVHKGPDGNWYAPEGWGSRHRYGWYCPEHNT